MQKPTVEIIVEENEPVEMRSPPTTNPIFHNDFYKDPKASSPTDSNNTYDRPYSEYTDTLNSVSGQSLQMQTEELRKFGKFSWNAEEDLDENKTDYKYDKNNCCIKFCACYKKMPVLIRYAIYSLTGVAVIFIPGLVSYFLFINDREVQYSFITSTTTNS